MRMPVVADDVHGGGAPITVRRRHADDLAPRGRHVTHQFAAVTFYTAGSTTIEMRGRWRLQAGDALVVPAGEPHRAVEVRRAEFWGLGMCVPCLPPHAAADLLAPFERVRAGGSAVVRVPAARRAYLTRLFRELHAEVEADDAAARVLVQHSLLSLIVHEIARATREPSGPSPRPGLAAEALRVIERRCLARLSPADVAQAVGRSAAHVTTALTRATGRSAGAWITAFRMAEARRLLLHGDLVVDDVSERVGYADTTHFIRTFRREHGATPAAWRDGSPVTRRALTGRPRSSARG